MSKAKSGIAVAAVLLSSLACAQQQAYVGASAGQSSTDDSSRKAAYKLFAGYDFTRTWAIEGAWADLGKPDWPQHGEARETSWVLAGKGTWPVNPQFDLFAKLGVDRNKLDINDSRKTDLYAAIGGEYNFNKQVGLRLEYEDFGKFGDDSTVGGRRRANMWTVGVDFKLPSKF